MTTCGEIETNSIPSNAKLHFIWICDGVYYTIGHTMIVQQRNRSYYKDTYIIHYNQTLIQEHKDYENLVAIVSSVWARYHPVLSKTIKWRWGGSSSTLLSMDI